MSKQTLKLDDRLYDYMLSVSLRDTAIQRELRDETNQLDVGMMQISPDQGQFMAMIARMIKARKVLEIGAFTGYSALVVAQALPEDGRLVTCDVSKKWTDVAQRYWRDACVSRKVKLRMGAAMDTLSELIEQGEGETFDLAFIDADKKNQWQYYELCLQLIRPGGVIMVDNVLWSGKVADPDVQDEDTVAIRRFNKLLYRDQRVDISMVPIGDGLTLALKRG
jgi:predicted O-methyltransferase YrrM